MQDYSVLGPTPALSELRRWAERVIADATPDADGAVGSTSDTEVTAARRFLDLDHHMTTGNPPADWQDRKPPAPEGHCPLCGQRAGRFGPGFHEGKSCPSVLITRPVERR